MIPSVVFANPRCATPDPVYLFLFVFATSGATVVVYSAFLLFCAWLAGLSFASRIRLAASRSHAPLFQFRLHPICRAFPTTRPKTPTRA